MLKKRKWSLNTLLTKGTPLKYFKDHVVLGFWIPSLDLLLVTFESQILGFFASSNLDLVSTRTSSETIDLKVIGSTLRVDIVGGKLRKWFASVVAALLIMIDFTLTRGINPVSSFF